MSETFRTWRIPVPARFRRAGVRKGVAFSIDMTIAALIFIAVFISVITAWSSVLDTSSRNTERKNTEILTLRIADELVRSGGYPSNWEDDPLSAMTIGLAGTNRVLDTEKVQAFINMDYETAKQILKTGGYDFQLKLINSGITKGPVPDSENIFYTRRVVLYNGANETMELYLWRS